MRLAWMVTAGLPCFMASCAPAPREAGRLSVERQVSVETGRLQGVLGPGDTVAFLGIPYAAPPTGEARWKPPHPALPWKGVLAANALGPSCPQPDRAEKIRKVVVTALGGDVDAVPPQGPKGFGPTSEDCLSLNVFAPASPATEKRPVMVWIHGGSFAYERGGEEAAVLARRGVVVVTFNYRLGLLGFLAHPALTKESPHHASGNYGLLDQIEALRWVQRNIAAFGGDPSRVTIFGHSAGGDSVLMLAASPEARGLFQRAIAQSSSLGESQSLATAEKDGVAIAESLGATSSDPLRALRAAPVERLLAAQSGVEPATEGWIIPKPIPVAIAEGATDGVPLIIGATAKEWSIFAIHSPPAKDRAAYRELLRKAGESHVERLLSLYPAARDEDVPAASIRYLSDWDFVCPARYIARKRKGRTWFYVASASATAGEIGARYGAFHGSDVRLLFHDEMGIPLGEPAQRTGDAMQHYWSRFARSGEPNEPGLAEWPVYGSQYLDLGDPIRVRSDGDRAGCLVFDEVTDAHFAK
ncbi:carboxylesterase family protein [Pendulispora brunnea]|uniref:Carboxylic ester hydrolase n=1 Tax=Pendulispora brunnea TaxID=2905690 RepID=A0ABZ2JVJ4_9BACT